MPITTTTPSPSDGCSRASTEPSGYEDGYGHDNSGNILFPFTFPFPLLMQLFLSFFLCFLVQEFGPVDVD